MTDNTTKYKYLAFTTLLIITNLILFAENNIYMQFFPELISYLHISEDIVDNILNVNMAGICIGSLISGPLSDSYGRRKILIGGFALYSLASFACFMTSDFTLLLIFRFIEGLATSVPYVLVWLIVFDRFNASKSTQLIGFVKAVSTFLQGVTPLFTLWLSEVFNWHLSLLFVFFVVMTCLIITATSIKESLPFEKRKPLNLLEIFRSYITLLKSFEFVAYTFIYAVSFSIYPVFFSNASIVFVEHLKIITEADFSVYQSISAAVFILSSLASIYLIKHKGINFTNRVAFLVLIMGCILMFIFGVEDDHNAHEAFISMMIIIAGGASMNGFLLKAVGVLPALKGSAMALNTSITIILSTITISSSELFFNGSFIPTASIVLCCAIIAIILYAIIRIRGKEILLD